MKILIVNAGSSSLKYQLIDMQTESVLAKGGCERIGLDRAFLKGAANGKAFEIYRDLPDHTVAIKLVLDTLTSKDNGVIGSLAEITAVGHRVVHSAEDYDRSVRITPAVLEVCRRNAELAPLHMPANILGIEACRAAMPSVPMVAVFDTAFHAAMPPKAFMYAIPYEDYTKYKVRRYGFHGTSHKFVSQEAAKMLGKPLEKVKIITCHLGNGASVAAVDGGRSVDTSMGFTPLEGLVMGTRSGDIDPAAVEYLMQKHSFTITQAIGYLNKKSGVDGISGVSSDFRDLMTAAEGGNARAKLAVEMFAYRVKKYIGAYAAVLGGVDAIVFTAGVGEHTQTVRAQAVAGLAFMGVKLDSEKNDAAPRGQAVDLSAVDSRVKIFLIPTNEELVIARETKELVE
jgi:acetate kinase